MVDRQLRARGITDKKVLQAFVDVPRHRFVDSSQYDRAYEDYPLPIGKGQTISQPYIVALMTEVIRPDSSDRVLEIGTGSGYQAAILAELVDSVFTIEIVEMLGRRAESVLAALGYDNVFVKIGNGYLGWPEHAPFDKIIVTAAPPEVPQALVDQLAEGGRMVLPVGDFWQELILITRQNGKIKREKITDVRFVPMVNDTVESNDRD